MKTTFGCAAIIAMVGTWAACVTHAEATAEQAKEAIAVPTGGRTNGPTLTKAALGKLIFADTALSEPPGQSCASCHDPDRAFADPRGGCTSEGAVTGRFGPRNSPSLTYASLAPLLSPAAEEGFAGGQFWDGRADTLRDQVKGPLLNPLEMNNADVAAVAAKLRAAPYASDLIALFGPDALTNDDDALARAGDAIAAYESELPNRFTSKYDAYLEGRTALTDAEARGLRLFEDPKTGPCTANADGTTSPPCGCAQCHLDQPRQDGSPPLFTDFGYDNIGIPHNAMNPFYRLPAALNPEGPNAVDTGLGGVLHDRRHMGKFKAPSLRNVALTAPYGHNGYFRTLKDVVHFYNTRDVPGAWFEPEHLRGVNRTALGDLRLSERDENDLVSFLETLTDGYGVSR